MYLHGKKYIGTTDWKNSTQETGKIPNKQYEEILKIAELEKYPQPEYGGLLIEFPLAYWRKVNAVHAWFTSLDNGIDECQDIVVSLENLKELHDICQKILDNPLDAEELLPTQAGFFFGSTGYDEWYYTGLRETIEQLTPIIEDNDDTITYVYSASW